MITVLIIISISVLLLILFRTSDNSNETPQIDTFHDTNRMSKPSSEMNISKRQDPFSSQRKFDNLDLNNFMGFIIKESSANEVKETLKAKGVSFSEHPDYLDTDGKSIIFEFKSGNINWSCSLQFKNDILRYIDLDTYNPNSYEIFKTLCKEMNERYFAQYNIRYSNDRHEGTETMTLEKSDNPNQFNEIVYDSSPILGQKNVYIKYWVF